MKPKKIAIFHNYMDNIGGAERVGLTLARELNADFYTTNIDKEKIKKMGFSDINLISIGKIPVNAPFRQQMALYFRKNLLIFPVGQAPPYGFAGPLYLLYTAYQRQSSSADILIRTIKPPFRSISTVRQAAPGR